MTRAGLLLFVSTLPLAVVLAGCGGGDSGPKAVPADAVAIVGNQPIERADFDAMVAETRKGYAATSRTFPQPGTPQYRTLRNKILDDFVQESEFAQSAKSQLGIEITDAQVDARVAAMRNSLYSGSRAKYVAGLLSEGLTAPQMRQRIRAQLLADAVFRKLSEKVKVSDDDVKAYYDSHHEGYVHPASRQVRVITVSTRARADAVERRLRNGADFAALAGTASTDTSTSPDGGLTTFTVGSTLAELDNAAFALKTNEVSAPVHTRNGWSVIRAVGPYHPATVTPYDQVKETVRSLLVQQARQTSLKAWVAKTRADFRPKTAYAAGFGPPAGAASAG